MNILFLNEYAHPFVAGGAEESTMQLARVLVARGHAVSILTPNYGAAPVEMIDGVRIERYAFPKRGNKERKTIGGWWHTSLFWWCYSSLRTVMAVRRLAPDLIHIHGKFSIPAGVIAGRMFGVPTLFTARDYRALCNYGRCISEHPTSRRCTFREYWRWEFPAYVRAYTDGGAKAWFVNALYALRGRAWARVLYAALKRVDVVVCVSRAVARIYEANGIWQTQPIYNIQQPLSEPARPMSDAEAPEALYIGKLSPGKGAGLLPEVIGQTLKGHPTLVWTIYTNGGVLERTVRAALDAHLYAGRVRILPYVPHEELMARIAGAAVVCIPSVWQEPLTRLALEALQSGTPVVITDRGGSREIVEDMVTGRLVPADALSIAEAVLDVVNNGAHYRERIREKRESLTNTFCVQPIADHERLYERLARRVLFQTLGVILPPGGSLTVLDRHGQKSRYLTYLTRYAQAFDRVLVFTFADETEARLPANVKLVPPCARSKRLYTFLLPFAHRRALRACGVLRVMQMDGCIPAVLAHWLYGVPFAATFGYKYAEFALLKNRQAFSKIMRWIEALGVRTATTIIFTTEELRAYLLKRFGPRIEQKLLLIPNGVDTRQFSEGRDRDPHTLLFVGRLEEQKNLFALLEAVAQLPERAALRLVWIGRGNLEGALRQRARELGVSLEIIPRVDNAALPPYYQKAGVFTLVSLIEGMPKALIEAMSAGCPCVVSDCDGNRVLVEDGVTGYVTGTDAPSIATGLARALGDAEFRSRVGSAARAKVVAQYDLRQLLEKEIKQLLVAKKAVIGYDMTSVSHMEHPIKKALITGIGGQDGFYMAELLLEKGYEVHGIIRHATSTGTDRMEQLRAELPHGSSSLLHLHYADLSDSGSIGMLLERIKPDELYNFAAHSQVRVSFDIPEYTCDITGLGAVRVFEAVRQSGLPTRVYQAGSSEMFGKARVTPQTEETPFYPRSPYAYAKALAHFAAVNYRESYGMFICNGILYNHESPRRGEMFVTRKITKTLARIAAGEDLALSLGNLDAERDWGYAPDYVEAVWRMLQQDAPDDYLLATGVAHRIRDFVEAAGRALHFDIRWEGHGAEERGSDAGTGRVLVRVDPKFFRPVEPEKLTGDSSKARAKLSWEPRTSFDDLVRMMVEADVARLKNSL